MNTAQQQAEFYANILIASLKTHFTEEEKIDSMLIVVKTGLSYNWKKEILYFSNVFKDEDTKKLIENTPNPKEVKKLGRLVKNYNDLIWDKVRLSNMVYVNYLKFSQNEDLKKELLDTGDKIMVEASPYDRIWGVGLDENNPLILDKANWNGLNLLGDALMEVRNKLRNGE